MERIPDTDMELDMIEAELNSTTTIDPSTSATINPVNVAEDALCTNRFDRPEAIYLFGLDNMSTKDIQNYCQNTALKKVEWIDDSSCVLVFGNDSDAQLAAQELLHESTDDSTVLNSTDLRNSKPFERPDFTISGNDDPTLPPLQPIVNNLSIRMATDSDIKTRGARGRSRYYLLHGERQSNDPGNRSNRTNGDGKPLSILDRLGSRVPPLSAQRRGNGGRYRHQNNDSDDNSSNSSSNRYDRSRRRYSNADRHHSRRRSLSPTRDSIDRPSPTENSENGTNDPSSTTKTDKKSPPSPATTAITNEDENKPYEIPENLRSRLGQLD